MRFFVFFTLFLCRVFAQENNPEAFFEKKSVFFEKLTPLLQKEEWIEIIRLGENALQKEALSPLEKFAISDQLVSSYFRLGLFEQAKEKALELISLGETISEARFVVDSLYKLSAALRGLADSEKDSSKQKQLFAESLFAIEKAFVICKEKCQGDKALMARVLFNRGAVHCDNPLGDVLTGITYYKEAISLFKELGEVDFTQRMMIRLGKACFLVGDLAQSREVIEELKLQSIEKRTYMHLLYLEAQVCLEEGNSKEALKVALQGEEIAVSLKAQHDMKRFEVLKEKIQLKE